MCFGLSRITKSLALIRGGNPVYILLDDFESQIVCKGQNSCRLFQYDLTLQLIVQLQTQCSRELTLETKKSHSPKARLKDLYKNIDLNDT